MGHQTSLSGFRKPKTIPTGEPLTYGKSIATQNDKRQQGQRTVDAEQWSQ
jgi:hypothetical protein